MSLLFAQMQRCPWNSARVVLGIFAGIAGIAYLLNG
jgi:hypothetical protein